jgi:hypothetical protein
MGAMLAGFFGWPFAAQPGAAVPSPGPAPVAGPLSVGVGSRTTFIFDATGRCIGVRYGPALRPVGKEGLLGQRTTYTYNC